VETREHSDWSKQAISTWSVEFTLWREGDTLRVGLVQEGATHLVRELFFDGPVAVGPYACSPKGPGFPVSVTSATDADGGWLMVARAGRVVSTAVE
jgi:regulation of enolase protein 1 (concanavalin A-like superfamily)